MKVIILVLLILVSFSSCKESTQIVVKEKMSVKNQNIEVINKIVKGIFTEKLDAYSIECPVISYGVLEKGKMHSCFGSNLDIEPLSKMISASFDPIASIYMGWREDVGTWTKIYDLKQSKYSLSITMEPPAMRDLMKDDPTVNKYKTIIACYITM